MITFPCGTYPKLLACLLLISGSFSTGYGQNLRDETSQAASTGWKIKFDGSDSDPVIANGVLYVGSADGAVYAFDPTNGATKWRFQTGEGLVSGPEIITVRPGASFEEQMAATKSALQHKSRGKREVNATPVVENGTVFIASGDFSFYALDAVTGEKKWSYDAGSMIFRTTVTEDSTAYIETDNCLHALDVATGKRKWLFETLQEIPVHPANIKHGPAGIVLGESAIFVTAWGWSTLRPDAVPRSFFYAVAHESGTPKWVTPSLAILLLRRHLPKDWSSPRLWIRAQIQILVVGCLIHPITERCMRSTR